MKDLDYKGYMKPADLRASLMQTHKIVRNSINVCDAAEREAYFEKTGKRVLIEHPDSKAKEGMIEDLNEAINQLGTGRERGTKRGAHRKGAYDVDKVVDPLYIQSYYSPTHSRSPYSLTEHHRFQLEEAFNTLTGPEHTCYGMARGMGASYSQIANALGVTVSTVRVNLKRADFKVNKELRQNMFLQEFEWGKETEE